MNSPWTALIGLIGLIGVLGAFATYLQSEEQRPHVESAESTAPVTPSVSTQAVLQEDEVASERSPVHSVASAPETITSPKNPLEDEVDAEVVRQIERLIEGEDGAAMEPLLHAFRAALLEHGQRP